MKKQKSSLAAAIAAVLALTIGTAFPSLAGTWKEDATGYWYQNDDGTYPANAWKKIDRQWYFFDNEGYMVHDRWIGNYYLSFDGAMLTDATTPDGYRVGADGAWIPDTSPRADTSDSKYSAYVRAKQYLALEYSAFSRQSLIDQLEFEGYNAEEAEYAADAVNADWTEQCLKRAELYRQYARVSDSDMKAYLKHDGFSDREITDALAQLD